MEVNEGYQNTEQGIISMLYSVQGNHNPQEQIFHLGRILMTFKGMKILTTRFDHSESHTLYYCVPSSSTNIYQLKNKTD